jgi:hypothetical protein
MLKFILVKEYGSYMYRVLGIFIVLLIFLGCSSKVNKYAKPTDTLKEQVLTATQKATIEKNGKVKAYVTVTHLNNVKQNVVEIDKETDVFLAGVYIPTEDKTKEFYNIVTVKVNGEEESCIEILKEDSPIIKLTSFHRPWTQYFFIESPKRKDKKGVTFEILIDDIGVAKLYFYDGYGNLPSGGTIKFKRAESND